MDSHSSHLECDYLFDFYNILIHNNSVLQFVSVGIRWDCRWAGNEAGRWCGERVCTNCGIAGNGCGSLGRGWETTGQERLVSSHSICNYDV